MSVEAAKPVEETPVVDATKALPEQPEASTAPAETSAEGTETVPAATEEPAAPATGDSKKDETAAEAVPASEGVLGYKEPTLFKKFFFTKHFFWFSEEPSAAESLTTFLRSEKADAKHSSAAWARETGKGLLFFSKRAEDKASPAGVINLADASNVIREGFQQFSFKTGNHQHRFEASKSEERDSWIVAIEKAIEEAKALKGEITGRESYKKNVEEYSKPPAATAAAVKTPRSKSKEPNKSLDATAATATTPAVDNISTSINSADDATKTNKERSQSRKRGSIFGTLLGKKEEHAEKKEEKAEAKKEVKEEKKADAEENKEEAKASEEPSKAVEAAEASAAATVPAAVVASDKKEEKEDASPTEKKAKRGSVFGNFFKNRVTSPTTEKSEKEAMVTKDSDVPPVSETAPKIEEPIENKPIDTAAVTAPVDTQAATSEEPAKEPTPAPAAGETSTTPKTEKKGLRGFIKKTEAKLEGKKEQKEEAKEEAKEAKTAEAAAKDPVAAAATTEPAETTATEGTETVPATTEERPALDNKRRTSLFFKKKAEASSGEDAAAEPKREKSPIPGGNFIGQLVRRASKAVKSEGPKEKAAAEPAATEPATTAPAAVPETSEATESKIVGDIVPENLPSTTEPVTSAAPEVKATA